MSSIKKATTSRRRKTLFPSRTGYLGSKNLNFNHQSTLDDTTIDLQNLNGYIPGVQNPGPNNFSNIGLFEANFSLRSATREYELVKGIDYTIIGTLVTFMNGFEALEDEQFTGTLLLPTSNAIVTESKTELSQFELPIGDVLLPIGTTYDVNINPSQQIGAIKVYRNGKIQLRCIDNDISKDGNYIEVDAGNGFGNQIQFKNANGSSIDGVVVDFGVHQVSDINVFSDLERLAGSIYQIALDLADETGNPVEDYFTASASEIDRLTLSNQVLQNQSDINTVEGVVNSVLVENGITSNMTGVTDNVNIVQLNITPGYWILQGNYNFNRQSGSGNTTLLRLRWNSLTSGYANPFDGTFADLVGNQYNIDPVMHNYNAAQDLSGKRGAISNQYIRVHTAFTLSLSANVNISGTWECASTLIANKVADL